VALENHSGGLVVLQGQEKSLMISLSISIQYRHVTDRHRATLLNRFRTGQGHCNACHKKMGFTDNEQCDCGEIQRMSHIVNSCPLTKFDGGLLRLHEADEAAVDWLTTYGS